ncbi:DNA polymerase IV [Mangrovibacterium diazotrophicum]|uniref:DNA polymerase IV n=1 Tax=Mangrovibacterium diazotrophicum TaxID=1261403 RepID=A0A419W2N1_9BACT|nr:DNA polymerase IV [Mangrovibacterium diazotrophicum]RKD89674.1 DNA polymerase-4 [Mangrovibacterium diazotrophicum]
MQQEQRKIIHIDMDAFYASVEQRDNPALKGQPVVVGGERERGVIAAASYEARKYGVRSAMSSALARRKCPNLVFVRPHFDKYKEVSQQIREIFFEYTDLVEPLSLDEAFLDVTHAKKGKPSATLIAKEIKARIKEVTNLTASAGVSYCKFLAKVASDVNKPDGIFVITPDKAEEFLEQLEVKKFFGIGRVTAEKLNKQGIYTGADLKKMSQQELVRQFGKSGSYYFNIVRGLDDRPVMPSRERKSLGAENTFFTDYTETEDLKAQLLKIEDEVWRRLQRSQTYGRTLTLKIKFADFEQITRSRTRFELYRSKESIHEVAIELLMNEAPFVKGIRLLGLTISNFPHEEKGPVQLTIEF